MPFVLRPPIRKLGLTGALVTAALAFAGFPAVAAADDCPDTPTTQIFSSYGDLLDYSLVPGGDFDFSTTGWTFHSAKPDLTDALKPSIAPFLPFVKSPKSLKIDKQDTAASPPVCVSVRHPSFRFFAFKKGGGTGNLDVSLDYTTSDGNQGTVPVGDLDSESYRTWSLGPSLPLWEALPLQDGEIAQVRLVFSYGFNPDGTPQPGLKNLWRIDEVYVDPYRR